ncbi:MAG: copper resistance protein CopC [Gemmatimonadota bacterium]
MSRQLTIRRALGLLISIFVIVAPRAAFAHAHLVKSVPSAGARVAAAPNTIQLWFSEAPEASLTTIILSAADGRVFQLGKVTAVPDTSVSVLAIINGVLAPGDYTVKWRTVAADDGHPSNGGFSFTVTGIISATGTATTATAPPSGSVTVIPTEPNAEPMAVSGMDVESPIYVIVRWLSFTGLVLLVGVVAFRLLVLPRVGASPALALARAGTHEVLATAIVPRLATLGIVAGLAVVIAAMGRLLAEQSVMAASMTMSVTAIVGQTTWGSVWLLQVGAAIVACAGFALARRRLGAGVGVGWSIAAIAALVLAVTPALSGHAAGMPHWRTFAVTTDAIHVISAGAWLGSLCVLVFVGLPAAIRTQSRNTSTGHSTGLMADMVNAFSPIALTFAAIVVLTGLISAWLRLGSVSALWRTSYGVVLLIKLALVGGVFAAGAFNWLRMRSALARSALSHAASGGSESPHASSSASVRFQRSGTFELVFGVLVIAATAVLVAMPTPVH